MEVVAGLVTLAVQKLTNFLRNDSTFYRGVKDDVEWINSELIFMKCFLKDAEQKQGTNEGIRQWVADIRDIAFQTENIIDDIYKEFKGKEPSKRKLFTTSSRDIGKKIKEVKEKLSNISRKREFYGINDIGSTSERSSDISRKREEQLQQRRRTTSLTDEEHFVGFDKDIVELKEKLLSNEQRRSVISIYGMGGLGKTSLARKLYNTNKDEFELHAWLCVSQEWNTRDLLEKIVMTLQEPTTDNKELKFFKNLDVDDMERILRQLLKDKRYLVVIDDMWDKESWECLRSALRDDKNKSRIIISTRSKLVANISDIERTNVHNLRRLQKDESWELFCKNAFSNQNGACPPDFEEIGEEMVAMCDGLPLAIIVLGGLLSRKQSNDEWRVIRKRIWRALIDKSIHISALLDLSYNDLAQEQKSCFLCLVFLLEDYEIDTKKLVQLWIAKDLIPSAEGRNPEELAESYIKELNARSLIQLNRTHYYPTSTCRVHDLVRDFALKKAKDESVNPNIRPLRSGLEKYTAIDDHSYSQEIKKSVQPLVTDEDDIIDSDPMEMAAYEEGKLKSVDSKGEIIDWDNKYVVKEELVAGVLLPELLDAVKEAVKKISTFKSILKSIESTLEMIKPYVVEITCLDEKLNQSGVGIDGLRALVVEGKVLVDQCSEVNFFNKGRYSDHLVDFDTKLLRYFNTVVQLEQLKGIRHLLVNQQKNDNVGSIKKLAQEIPIKLGYETSSSSGIVPVEESIDSICARDLAIEHIKSGQYWKWSSITETSSDHVYEVAELLKVWFFHVRGYFGTETLQHGIEYKVAFEVMLIDSASGWEAPVKLKLILPDGSVQERGERIKSKPRNQWLQITVGNFTMSSSTVGTIVFSLEELTMDAVKKGILIKGAVITKAQ